MTGHCIALFLLFGAPALFCADWPQWRGPGRDGSLPAFHEPQTWPERLNRKWKITIGQGHASPVFAAARIYGLSRRQNRETVASIDPGNGKLLWNQSYEAP